MSSAKADALAAALVEAFCLSACLSSARFDDQSDGEKQKGGMFNRVARGRKEKANEWESYL
jgi:hypothetical protein